VIFIGLVVREVRYRHASKDIGGGLRRARIAPVAGPAGPSPAHLGPPSAAQSPGIQPLIVPHQRENEVGSGMVGQRARTLTEECRPGTLTARNPGSESDQGKRTRLSITGGYLRADGRDCRLPFLESPVNTDQSEHRPDDPGLTLASSFHAVMLSAIWMRTPGESRADSNLMPFPILVAPDRP
jgi:hypothetical protein